MPPGFLAGSPSLVAILPLLPATASLFVLLTVTILGLLGAALRLRPAALKTLARILWRQKPGLIVLSLLMALVMPRWQHTSSGIVNGRSEDWTKVSWPMFRGSLSRSGHADSQPGPTSGSIRWSGGLGFQFYSSPAIIGDDVIAIGSQQDTARVFCWDAESGALRWTIAPRSFRATLSSAVVADGYLFCGEGLHQTSNSRVLCLEPGDGTSPKVAGEFSTLSHVECTPVLSGGRIFVNAGDDGVYCLERASNGNPDLKVVWHLPGSQFPDAETALAVHDGRVYVGLGFGGEALCVLDAETGREIARIKMPYPVFSPPAIANGRVYIGMGRANYVSHADTSPGELRCIDLESLQTLWKIETPAALLAAIVVRDQEIIFSTVNGELYVADDHGKIKRRWNARVAMLTAPAVTAEAIYCVSCDGMLTALDRQLERVWSVRLGAPGNYISSPIVAHGQVFVGTPDDGFLCVGDRPGLDQKSVWSATNQVGVAIPSPIPPAVDIAWTLSGPADDQLAEVSAPPAITRRELVVPMTATNWSGLVCVELEQSRAPRRRWIWDCLDRIETAPAITGNTVLCIAGRTGSSAELVALDRQSGRELWRHAVASADDSMCVDGDSVYVSDVTGLLSRISLTGQLRWRAPVRLSDLPIVLHDEIIAGVAAKPNELFALDRMSGKVLWQVDLPYAPQESPAIFGDRILIATTGGIEVRSLVDGSLRKPLTGWAPAKTVFTAGSSFVGTTAQSELVIGSLLVGNVQRRSLNANPNVTPLVGTNAVVYAKGDSQLMWLALDGLSEPRPWFSAGPAARIVLPPVFSAGRTYISLSGKGLVCLKTSADTL